MTTTRTLILAALCAALCAPAFTPALAQKKERPKAIKIEPAELDDAAKLLAGFDGEQQMLLNGLRYLMRPLYEAEVMIGRRFEPCPLPPYEVERKKPMTLMDCLRFWAVMASGMPADEIMKRELRRFLETEHERYGDTLAGYAVPMAVCVVATRRPELEHTKELKECAKTLMDTAMRVRSLTEVESPLIKGMYIEPAWYANHMWRSLMCRCAMELKVKFNENVWEAELKNLSHAAQKELGWISTQGKARTGDNDLNSNLLALSAISLALSAPAKSLDNGVIDSLGKRLEYLRPLLTRLETEYPTEALAGARLCLVRTLLPEYAPTDKDPVEWRLDLRVKAVNAQFASGAVYTDHRLVEDMGLCGTVKPSRARPVGDTALSCLSLCGGLFRQVEPPLKDLKPADIEQAMKAQSLQHASVLPATPEGGDLAMEVEFAIEAGCDWLISQQNNNGTFGPDNAYLKYPGVTGLALLALMHGGVPADDKCIERGVQWILTKTPGGLINPQGEELTVTAYDAGILLMMFQKLHEATMAKEGVFSPDNVNAVVESRRRVWESLPDAHRKLIQNLVEFLEDCYVGGDQGGWNYWPNTKQGVGHSDHSISQYAGCGYKCASMLGATIDVSVFENEAKRLIAQYGAAKGTKFVEFDSKKNKRVKEDTEGDVVVDDRYASGGTFEPRHFTGLLQPGGWGYFCMKAEGCTGMQYAGTGMAILAACRDELWVRKKLPLDLHKQIDLHIFGAQAWIGMNFPKEEAPLDRAEADEDDEPKGKNARVKGGGGGWGGIYNLYAVERGCMMAGYELLNGEVDWYRVSARQLVNNQAQDGKWGDVLGTAMAVLILRRASIPMVTQPPTTPPENPKTPPAETKPKSPISPGVVKPEPKPPKPVGPVTPGK